MFQYSIDKFHGNHTCLYRRSYYIGGSNSFDAQLKKFNEHIVYLLIEYIELYLENICADMLKQEQNDKLLEEQYIIIQNTNNSTIVMNSKVSRNVIINVKINDDVKIEVEELLKYIKSGVISINLDTKEEVFELISEIDENIKSNQNPKKSILTALKELCRGAITVIPLVTKLLEIFYK